MSALSRMMASALLTACVGCASTFTTESGIRVECWDTYYGSETGTTYYGSWWGHNLSFPAANYARILTLRAWNDHDIAYSRTVESVRLSAGEYTRVFSIEGDRPIEYFTGREGKYGPSGGREIEIPVEAGLSQVSFETLDANFWGLFMISHLDWVKGEPFDETLVGQTATTPAGQLWAVVIGISDYKYSGDLITDLRYAHRDAAAMAKWLVDLTGGGYEKDHVLLLKDEQATHSNVSYALMDFLKKTVKEDVVIIFFSGHGMPDPEKPANFYLLCHDTRPDRMASTAVSMSLLDEVIKDNIAAERVLMFLDACHAGEVGVKGVRLGNSINDKLTDPGLFAGQPGKLVFTSSEANEVSRESDRWDGGHGVFTWALLNALRGDADGCNSKKEDGQVTLGELLDYVDLKVRQETGSTQHPQKVGRFDRNMIIGRPR